MRLSTKHSNWALLCALLCVLGGAFGLGDDADERQFRNRSRGGGRGHSQSHQVLDSIHDDVLAFAAGEASSGGNGHEPGLCAPPPHAPPCRALSVAFLGGGELRANSRGGGASRKLGRAPPAPQSLL